MEEGGMRACGCWDHATSNLDYESAPKWFFHCCDECEKTCVSCKKMDDDDDLLARFNDVIKIYYVLRSQRKGSYVLFPFLEISESSENIQM